MERQALAEALKAKGVHVIGTTEDFGIGGQGLWVSGESNPGLFDYYSERWMNTFGVQPALNAFVEKNGWYFEWYDTDTMMVWRG